MPRIVRIVPALLLILAAHAAAAQESGDTAQAIGRIGADVSIYQALAQARAVDLGRRIDVLGQLTEAADMVSPFAMDQSLGRARKKVEEARAEANREPALEEPVSTVIDIVSGLVTTPPFGTPGDQLRAKIFVEIGKLEEDILHQCEVFQREANTVDGLLRNLARIEDSLRAAAVAGGKASLYTRKRALKAGQ
jgi:hypothetical protein